MNVLTEKTVFYDLDLKKPEEENNNDVDEDDNSDDNDCDEKEDVYSKTPEKRVDSEEEWDTDLEDDDQRSGRRMMGDEYVRQVYLAACRHLKIVPSSCFLKGLNTSVINLSFQGLGPVGIKAAATALVMDRNTGKLMLAGNLMGHDGVRYICEMLTENVYITDLDLSDNDVDGYGLEMLAGVFKENETLTNVKLCGNRIKGMDAEHVAAIMRIPHYVGLRSIDLSHNELGDEGGRILGHAIGDNETVSYLNISWNQLRKGGIECIAAGLSENNSLKQLDMSSNGLGNEGAALIGEALSANRMLEVLDLSSNRIGLSGIMCLFTDVAKNEKLSVIKLTNNPITSQGPTAALTLLLKSECSVLKEIEIADAVAPREFNDLLVQMQEIKPDFKVVLAGFMDTKEMCKAEVQNIKDSWVKDPMLVFIHFIEDRKLKLFDMFKRLDTDKSCTLSRDEFVNGLLKAGCPLTAKQFGEVMKVIDVDHDGEIDIGEFLDGYERHKKRYMKMVKNGDSRISSSTSSGPSSRAASRPSSSSQPRPNSSSSNTDEQTSQESTTAGMSLLEVPVTHVSSPTLELDTPSEPIQLTVPKANTTIT